MLENRKDAIGLIVEGLRKQKKIEESLDYEAFFESMQGEPGMDAWETTNEEWLKDDIPIDEAKMVTPQGRMYPKKNIAVVLSGGAGSGKSYLLKHNVAVEGKVINVDDLKDMWVKAIKKGKLKDPSGRIDYNFKNPKDVSDLHQTIKDKNFKEKQEDAFFGSYENGDRPNVIYDITGDSADKLKNTGKMLKDLGYHVVLVWVVTNRQVALMRNMCRSRVVSQEVFHSTHNGVLKNVLPFLKSAGAQFYNEAWVVFSSADSLKELTPEQQKAFDDYKTVKLTKNGSKFEVPVELEERILTTLGPEETDPANSKVYKSYQDIEADLSIFDRAKQGKEGLLR